MASAGTDPVLGLQEEALCPICLESYRDPVSVECGHSFCRSCINRTWRGLQCNFPCPHCRKVSRWKKLRPNRQLASMTELAGQIARQEADRCSRHQEPLRLYCEDDQQLLCLVCRESWDHRAHRVVPLEESTKEYKVRVLNLVVKMNKAATGTGGEPGPPIKLTPWEESCRTLMDVTALEGVGTADYGVYPSDDDKPGTSGQSCQLHIPPPPRKRKAVQPLPPPSPPPPHQGSTTPVPAPTTPALVTRASVAPSLGEHSIGSPTPAPVNTAGPARGVIILEEGAPPTVPEMVVPQEEETFILTFTPNEPAGGDYPDSLQSDVEDDVVQSPSNYSLPPDDGEGATYPVDERPMEEEDANMIALLQRLQNLEQMSRLPSQHEANLLEAMRQQGSAGSTTALEGTGTIGGLQDCLVGIKQQLEQSEKSRKVERKRRRTLHRANVVALHTLHAAVAALTEQVRLTGDKIANVVTEQTAAMRQMQ